MEIFKSKNDYDHDGIRSLYALRDLVSVKKMTNAQISSVLRLQKEESQLDLGFENEQDLQVGAHRI